MYSCTGDAERKNVCFRTCCGLDAAPSRGKATRYKFYTHTYIHICVCVCMYVLFFFSSLRFCRDFLLSHFLSSLFFSPPYYYYYYYIIGQKKEAARSITPLDYSTLSYYACYLELLDLSALYFGITRLKTRIVLSRIISINSYVTSREASFYDALATINYQQHARL